MTETKKPNATALPTRQKKRRARRRRKVPGVPPTLQVLSRRRKSKEPTSATAAESPSPPMAPQASDGSVAGAEGTLVDGDTSLAGEEEEAQEVDANDDDEEQLESDLGTPAEVARYLAPDGPSERTIQRLVADEEIPKHMIRGRTLVSAEDVHAYWERQRTTTPLSQRLRTSPTESDTAVAPVTSDVGVALSSGPRAAPTASLTPAQAAVSAVMTDVQLRRAEIERLHAELDAAQVARELARVQQRVASETEAESVAAARAQDDAELARRERDLALAERKLELQWKKEDRQAERDREAQAQKAKEEKHEHALEQRIERVAEPVAKRFSAQLDRLVRARSLTGSAADRALSLGVSALVGAVDPEKRTEAELEATLAAFAADPDRAAQQLVHLVMDELGVSGQPRGLGR